MYDKYNRASPITIGSSKIPNHKAILFSGATAETKSPVVLHLIQNTLNPVSGSKGNTVSVNLNITTSPYILPIEVFAIPSALPSGITAYYLN